MRWSSDSEEDTAQEGEAESEDPTEFGVVWKRHIIKKTEEAEMEPIGHDMEGKKDRPDKDGVDYNGEQWTVEARKERTESTEANVPNMSSQVPSPSLSDFEAFWGNKNMSAAISLRKKLEHQQDRRQLARGRNMD